MSNKEFPKTSSLICVGRLKEKVQKVYNKDDNFANKAGGLLSHTRPFSQFLIIQTYHYPLPIDVI